MKRRSNLYENITTYENILSVVNDIFKTCRNKNKSMNFRKNLNTNIYGLREILINQNYIFSEYQIFLIKDPKYRIIMSENITDKIVNHLVSRYILLPSIEKCNIDTNAATRIGKGSDYAFKFFCKYVHKIGLDKNIYALKVDISKYFYNIDHEILYKKLKRKIKEKSSLDIITKILDTTNSEYINKKIECVIGSEISRVDSLNISVVEKLKIKNELNSIPRYNYKKGLPIGNMSSQLFAVFYLNDLDHYIKEFLKCRYYIRYMDDLIILDTDKERLKNFLTLIKNKLIEEKLLINKKSNICNLKNGFSFIGYTFKIKYNTLWIRYNNKTIRRISKRLRRNKGEKYSLYYKSKLSYNGYLKKCNTS